MKSSKTVSYKQFGATGDGKTNDMEAIIQTHAFANENGCNVVADPGARYYIGFTKKSAVIQTDVDFGDAEFIIDDAAKGIHAVRGVAIFHICRDTEVLSYQQEDLAKITADTSVAKGAEKIPWLAEILPGKSLVMLSNKEHLDYIRFGSNRNSGSPRREMIIIEKDGTVDKDIPVTFAYEKVTDVSIINAEDKPITIQGGKFVSICCRAGVETNFQNQYASYQRGFLITRANVTLQNMDHKMQDEPETTGNQDESYPYGGFFTISLSNNVKILDCDLTGHVTYYEDRTHIANNPSVPMGSYDLTMNSSTHIHLENVTQSQTPVDDYRYWGIMGSSYCKNFTFIRCKLSRFDAHCGFWNAKLIHCEFGQNINVIGGGELYIENTTRTIGHAFINLRQDYGATFEGNITLKNCTLGGVAPYNSGEAENNTYDESRKIDTAYIIVASVANGANPWDSTQNYYDWDFGYTCHMPKIVTIENFSSGANSTLVFNDVRDAHFQKEDKSKEYRRCEKVIFKNNSSVFPLCQNNGNASTLLSEIPVEIE